LVLGKKIWGNSPTGGGTSKRKRDNRKQTQGRRKKSFEGGFAKSVKSKLRLRGEELMKRFRFLLEGPGARGVAGSERSRRKKGREKKGGGVFWKEKGGGKLAQDACHCVGNHRGKRGGSLKGENAQPTPSTKRAKKRNSTSLTTEGGLAQKIRKGKGTRRPEGRNHFFAEGERRLFDGKVVFSPTRGVPEAGVDITGGEIPKATGRNVLTLPIEKKKRA